MDKTNHMIISNGLHQFSGISDYSYNDYNGYIFIIDNNLYFAYEDPDDGYRSYGYLEKMDSSKHKCSNIFKAEQVFVVGEINEEKTWKYTFYNAQSGTIILEIGTDYTDSYYPISFMHYYPENLQCNANKQSELLENLENVLKKDLEETCKNFVKHYGIKNLTDISFNIDGLEYVNNESVSNDLLKNLVAAQLEVTINNKKIKI